MFEIGKWTQVKIVMAPDVPQTNVDVYVGGKKVIDGYKTSPSEPLLPGARWEFTGVPHKS